MRVVQSKHKQQWIIQIMIIKGLDRVLDIEIIPSFSLDAWITAIVPKHIENLSGSVARQSFRKNFCRIHKRHSQQPA